MGIFFLVIVATMFGGCASNSENDTGSSVPWSRPASWENQLPGMGGLGY